MANSTTATAAITIDSLAGDVPARAVIRRHVCDSANHPIEVVPGDDAPAMAGQGYYHTTPSGRTVVRHPNAYRWPTAYHASTLHTEVGERWLQRLVRDGVRDVWLTDVHYISYSILRVSCLVYVRCRSRTIRHGIAASECWWGDGRKWLLTMPDGAQYLARDRTVRAARLAAFRAWRTMPRAA